MNDQETQTRAEVARRTAPPAPIAKTRANLARFEAVLPATVDANAFVGNVEAALYSNADLMKGAGASPAALFKALMRCAALGHMPGTDEFYLTPRKVGGKPSILGIEGYRGIVERMYRSGAVANVIVREVCRGDRFEFVEGMHDRPLHEIDWESVERGDQDHPMILVYAYAKLVTGAWSRVVVLNAADIAATKASSDSARSKHSPWNREDGGPGRPGMTGRSMWLKTAARRLEPWVPTSAEYRLQLARTAQQAQQQIREEVGEDAARGFDLDDVDTETGEIHDAELVDGDGDSPGDR